MQQQFTGASLVVVGDVSVRIRADMNIEQESLSVLDEAVGVLEVGLAFSDGLDFSAAQSHAGFEFLKQEVVMAGDSVVGGVALAGGHGVARPRRLLGSGRVLGYDDMAGLAGHREATSNLHRSIGAGFSRCVQ